MANTAETHLSDWFATHDTVTTANAHEALGVMRSTAKVYLSNLSKKGILKRLDHGVYGPGDNWNAPSPISVSHKSVGKPTATRSGGVGRPMSPERLLRRERDRLLAQKEDAERRAAGYTKQIEKIDTALAALASLGDED
jgi:DeoR/GlpR family transcriptional regulator of sugar metabolism